MKIIYLCDGYACTKTYGGKCPLDPCRHTTKINHAINFTEEVTDPKKDKRFTKINGVYVERGCAEWLLL